MWLIGFASLSLALVLGLADGSSLGDTIMKTVASALAVALSYLVASLARGLAKKFKFDLKADHERMIRDAAYNLVMAAEQKATAKFKLGAKFDASAEKKLGAVKGLIRKFPTMSAEEAEDCIEGAVGLMNENVGWLGKTIEAAKS